MKKTLMILSIVLLFGFELIAQGDHFKLSGVIIGNYSDYVYLNYEGKRDSSKVLNNAFEFKGHVEMPVRAWLHLKPDASLVWIWIENSEIEVIGDFIKGTQDGRSINIFKVKDIKGSFSSKIEEDYIAFYRSNKDKDNFKELLYEKLKILLHENRDLPYSGDLLGSLAAAPNPLFTTSEFSSLYSLIDTTKQSKIDLERFKIGVTALSKYGIGKPFFRFKLPDMDGKEIAQEAFLGKIVLVDFWASWCKPCRAKHPDLVKLKNEYESKNFDIVSISLDKDRNNWLKAIEKDQLRWTNLLDIDKETSNELGILAIPHNFLIDDSGNILGNNLSIENIKKVLNKK